MFGRRPIATSRSVPWMVSSVSPASTISIRWRCRRTRSTLTPLRIVMPSRANASSTMAAHSGILLAERLRLIEHGDLGAKPAERLGKLEPDRAGAEDDQMLRPLADLECVLVGEIGHLLEPGNRRHDRPRAGRDHEAARPDLELHIQLRADDDGPAVAKPCLALDHADAKTGEALLGIVRCDRVDDAMDVVVDLVELDGRLARP